MAVTQLDPGGAAENAGMFVGDVIVKFLDEFVHTESQKEIVQRFQARGMQPTQLVVKNVSRAPHTRAPPVAAP